MAFSFGYLKRDESSSQWFYDKIIECINDESDWWKVITTNLDQEWSKAKKIRLRAESLNLARTGSGHTASLKDLLYGPKAGTKPIPDDSNHVTAGSLKTSSLFFYANHLTSYLSQSISKEWISSVKNLSERGRRWTFPNRKRRICWDTLSKRFQYGNEVIHRLNGFGNF